MACICLQEGTQGDWIWIYYCLCLILKYHSATFSNTESGISLFLLCWLTALLPKVEAQNCDCNLKYAIDQIADVEKLYKHKCSVAVGDDLILKLYTPSDIRNCTFRKLWCFLEELKVISHECEEVKSNITQIDGTVTNDPHFRDKEVNHQKDMDKCLECEEFPESEVETFIQNFKEILQYYVSKHCKLA